jgi:VWFA-related protein
MKASHGLYLFLLGNSILLSAQQAAPRNPGSSNPLITLDVVVTNKSGIPQAGLQQQDFTLLDNKTPQKIVSFQAVDESAAAASPVEIILFMDTVNATVQTVSDERLQIQNYLRQNGGKLTHLTSVVVFADSGLKNLGEPTRDGNSLSANLDQSNVIGLRTIHRAAGAYGGAERLTSSLRNLYSIAAFEANKPGRKILIWISPGWPVSGTNMYSEIKDQLFSSLVLVSTALQQARITLYSIDPVGAGSGPGKFSYESYLKGVPAAKDVVSANLSLQVLATRSGVKVLTTGNNIGDQIDGCIADTKAFYVLSFESIPTEHQDEYHNLDLKVDKPGLTARTSEGYYAHATERPGAPGEK